jgi:hypothetical protein
MNSSQTNKIFKMIKKAINNVPLMDVYNISSLITDYIADVNTYFVFTYGWNLYDGVPHYIKAIILAPNEEEAFELLKLELNKMELNGFYDNRIVTFNLLNIENFEVFPLYNYNLIIVCEPRIDYLVVKQGYWDGSYSYDLEYTFYEFKQRSKPQKKWVNLYTDRHDYLNVHSYCPDERIYSKYSEDIVEEAQNSIQYLF